MTTRPGPVHDAHPGLVRPLAELWTVVTRKGGAVGFLVDDAEAEIHAAAEQAIAEVMAGRHRLIAAHSDQLDGVVFLVPGRPPRKQHVATLLRLMVHPDRQGEGLGRALLDAAVTEARSLGFEQLVLSARGGTTLPAFYRGCGWTEVGLFPGVLHIGSERRDEHWFQFTL